MKDHLLQIARAEPVDRRQNVVREYLHAYVLRLLHDAGAMSQLAFVGGTALRLLYRLPRFSENLDFCAGKLEFPKLFSQLERRLGESGYGMALRRAKTTGPVVSVFLHFEGLPRACGWSADPRLGVSVKLEFDRRPPVGAHIQASLIQRFFPVLLRHYDLPSLFAGKLHAILARPYAKGRDWFDLTWYMTEHHGLEPNRLLLSNALKQTGHKVPADWRQAVVKRLDSLVWKQVLTDLRPFVERQSDLEVITKEGIKALLTAPVP